jgi:ribosomal protein S18 acetylase RimI-like enzyme
MDPDFLKALSVEKREEGWRKSLADPEVFAQSAFEGNDPVGFITAGPSRLPDFADGEIYALYVAASAQRRSIGRVLFRAASRYWSVRGGRSLAACVIAQNNKAINFYGREGGKVVGEQPFELGGMRLAEKIFVFTPLV